MEYFSYKGGCGICRHMHIERCLKQELTWATDKRLQVISNMKLKSKAVLCLNNIVSVATWFLVMYSNCFKTYYRLMLHGSTIKVCFMFSSV